MIEAYTRIRISQKDAHYGGNLVDGSKIVQLYGDLATEILIKHDGDEGLFLVYDKIELLEPLYVGDFIEARAVLEESGNTSRKISFETHLLIKSRPEISESAADYLSEPILVSRAKGTCIVKKDKQRIGER